MAKQKLTGLSASLLEQPQIFNGSPDTGTIEAASGRTIVQTVKVPPDVFVRLKTVGARERRSSQDIILSALRDYLDRFPDT